MNCDVVEHRLYKHNFVPQTGRYSARPSLRLKVLSFSSTAETIISAARVSKTMMRNEQPVERTMYEHFK